MFGIDRIMSDTMLDNVQPKRPAERDQARASSCKALPCHGDASMADSDTGQTVWDMLPAGHASLVSACKISP